VKRITNATLNRHAF